MDHIFEYDANRQVVRIPAAGDQNAGQTALVVAGAIAGARSKDCRRFLFDIRKTVIVAWLAVSFDLVESLPDPGFLRTDRIAPVIRNQEGRHSFYETFTENRGGTARYFLDETEALEWLTCTDLSNEVTDPLLSTHE